MNPLVHYIRGGAREGRDPNPLFDSDWYLAQNPDAAIAGGNPLEHYITHGEKERRRPNRYFDVKWYYEKYNSVMELRSALADYLQHAFSGERQPNEVFDNAWYLASYPDVRSSGIMPLRHFLLHGAKEGRDPGPAFDTRYYLRANPDAAYFGADPFLHYLEFGQKDGRFSLDPYPDWIEKYGQLTHADQGVMRARIETLEAKPVISILCPVYNADLEFLDQAVKSVLGQIYPYWELCLSDDASTNPGVVDRLKTYAASDPRIKLYQRAFNEHIAANTNSAVALATGDFVAFLDSDDELTEDALFWVANEIETYKDADIIFSDEDKIDPSGNRFDAYFKSDWNPALMLSQNAVCHLSVIRRKLFDQVGRLREGFNGSQDHELMLRCSRAVAERQIRHIPRVLYHWRAAPTSTALVPGGKPYAWEAGRRAILDHLRHNGVTAEVEKSSTGHYTVCYAEPREEPLVSILMPSACKLAVMRPCFDHIAGTDDLSEFRNHHDGQRYSPHRRGAGGFPGPDRKKSESPRQYLP